MDKPTPLFHIGDNIHIPDVPSLQDVKGIDGTAWIYGKCAAHSAGTVVSISKVMWASHMAQWVYSIKLNRRTWNYLESDLLMDEGRCFLGGQPSLFSI